MTKFYLKYIHIGHELTVDDLRDIDGADLNTLLQYLPLKQKIQFKRELKTWLSEDKNQNVQQDDVPSDFQVSVLCSITVYE